VIGHMGGQHMDQAVGTIEDPGQGRGQGHMNVPEEEAEDLEHAHVANLRKDHIEMHVIQNPERVGDQNQRKNLGLDLQKEYPDPNQRKQRIPMEGRKLMHGVLEIKDQSRKKNHQ